MPGGGLQVPVAQRFEGHGIIRWAVGSPEGPRSQTWMLIGRSNGDIYLAPRHKMHEVKLSLHPTKWRMAWTEQAAAHHVPPGQDRVITRWDKPPEMRRGWRHAACVGIATSNLGAGYPEKKPSIGTVGWFSPVPMGRSIRFDVLVAEPDHDPLAIWLYSDVGRIDFPDGSKVWVIATVPDEDPEADLNIRRMRHFMAAGEGYGPDARSWVWGESGHDRSPLLMDFSDLVERPDDVSGTVVRVEAVQG